MSARKENSEQPPSPAVSLVVTSITAAPAVAECLVAVLEQTRGRPCEIVVVESLDNEARARLRSQFPHITMVHVDPAAGIPGLRAVGFEQTHGDVIAFIGEHYVPEPGWYDAIVRAHERGDDGVGGPVEMRCPRTPTNWAVYLCEYSGLMLPAEPGDVAGLAGNNCAYRRTALTAREIETLRTSWEFFVQQELRARGVRLHFDPSMAVSLKRNFSLGQALGIRFAFSRSFAAMRRERIGAKSLVYALLAPALVPLMAWRIAAPILRKRRYLREFTLASPLIALLCLSAALGEAAGYVLGSGESLGDVQ